MRVGGEERWIAAEEAGLYRDALGVVPPGGLPEAFLDDVPDALLELAAPLRAHPRTVRERRRARAASASTRGAALAALEQRGELVRGELRPLGHGREWCDPEVLRRVRRASLAVLRREIAPVGREALARFAPAWQGVDRRQAAGAGVERLRDVLAPLQGLPLAPELVGARRAAAPPGRLLAGLARRALRDRRARLGGGRRHRPAHGPRRPVLSRRRAAARSAAGRAASASAAPDGPVQELVRARLRAGACFFTDLLLEYPELGAEELRDALWDLVWAGEATNDAFARCARAGSPPRAPACPRWPAAGSMRRCSAGGRRLGSAAFTVVRGARRSYRGAGR